eukprot:CAMPEP_0118979520 /NCGR_PEP_ID=MMETSP1173-20130426/26149_1 /TAXON_ID=1034831 /ORGANISM="Rhizochromulina marina cf, Strain CCMP1243" /LENGTH=296 /DNA_ID=CAMNT_0006929785 /DNA_START=164 /DNA_END=1054 /DNA_ORIENTATION=+
MSKPRRGLRSLDPNQMSRIPPGAENGPVKPRATPVASKRSQPGSQHKVSVRISQKLGPASASGGGGSGTSGHASSTSKTLVFGEAKTPRSRRALGDVSNRTVEAPGRGAALKTPAPKTPAAKTPGNTKTPGKSGFRILKTHQTPRVQAATGAAAAAVSAVHSKPRSLEDQDDVPDIECPAGRVYEDEQGELEAVREARFRAELRELFQPEVQEIGSLSRSLLDEPVEAPLMVGDGLEFTELAMLDDVEFDRMLEQASEEQGTHGQEKKRTFDPSQWEAEAMAPEDDEDDFLFLSEE